MMLAVVVGLSSDIGSHSRTDSGSSCSGGSTGSRSHTSSSHRQW